jgi:hypothetical protein
MLYLCVAKNGEPEMIAGFRAFFNGESTLTLLVAGILADYPDHALALDYLAVATDALY